VLLENRHLFDVHLPGTWPCAKVKCGVSTKIARPNAIRLCPVGALKNVVYTSEPGTLQDLRREIKIDCASVPLATIQNVCQSVARRCQQ
jgi:hypothetical protein